MSQNPLPEHVHVLKIGAVVLRAVASTNDALVDGRAAYEILIIRTHAKHVGEVPPFVLPRGSRQYFIVAPDGSVAWQDARDAATGAAHADALEPFTRGLEREIEEEAGVDADMLARAQLRELGAREFQSRNKGVYPIHWFEVVLAVADAAQLTQQPLPKDTAEMRWASLPDIKEMAARGEFSAGYVPVIEEALATVG